MKPVIALTGGSEAIGSAVYLAVPRTYFIAVEGSGGLPVAVDLSPARAQDILRLADGLLLTGGWDVEPSLYGQARHEATSGISPLRDETEIALARAFFYADKPILAICRGIQVLAVALGGTLVQHIPDVPGVQADHGDGATRHPVHLAEGSRLRAIYGHETVTVNSTHHQSVDQLPIGFSVSAISCDGVIEGVEGGRAIGVQWHPERMLEDGHSALFEAFIAACGEGR